MEEHQYDVEIKVKEIRRANREAQKHIKETVEKKHNK